VNGLLPHFRRYLTLAIILLMQGPALLVQEVAWVKMLVTYSQERGLKRGVLETFDGKHPCKMCAKAVELRKSEGHGDPRNLPQEKKSLRLSWGEMVPAKWLDLPQDSATGVVTISASGSSGIPGRGKESPALPPPKLG
jgi:hypothetical protein